MAEIANGSVPPTNGNGSANALHRRETRAVTVGTTVIGGTHEIVLQSMCATRTQDIAETAGQIRMLHEAGASLIRIAVDSSKDVDALREIRKETTANLVVDLQENYRLAKDVAPFVQKFRYNPGHLHHHQKNVPVIDKVRFLADVAGEHDCAIRVGVNFGSLDPALRGELEDPKETALKSAGSHCEMLESAGFKRYVVSLKSSHPLAVVEINKAFAERYPDVPLHLGVTEAGLLPDAEIKTRIAFEKLLALGIGETIRVSLTVPDHDKHKEISIARAIVDDVRAGRFRSVPELFGRGLNVISCPSCSRVENKAFVALAEKVREAAQFAKQYDITIAVMGCRVNGPGETDEADLGLWCGPNYVNLKRRDQLVGAFPYDVVVSRLEEELHRLISERAEPTKQQARSPEALTSS